MLLNLQKLILLLWSHFCSQLDQFHISSEDLVFLLVGIVAELKSNIVSYLPAANSRAAGFLFSSKWMVVWRQVKDFATICCSAAAAAAAAQPVARHFDGNALRSMKCSAFVEGLLTHSNNVRNKGGMQKKETLFHSLLL